MWYVELISNGYNNVMLDVCESYGEASGIKAHLDTVLKNPEITIVIEEVDDDFLCSAG